MNSDITMGSALAEPLHGRPVELPIRAEGTGNPPPRVKVHVELGIPIYFDPASAQFSAHVGAPVQGKGSASELHSADFALIVERVRERALVTPVQGYLVSVNHLSESDEGLVQVRACTVIEHHPRRQMPFVVRVVEEGPKNRWDRAGGPPKMVERIRSTSEVMLPTPADIKRVRDAQRAVLDEEERHKKAQQRLYQGVRDALNAIPRLTTHHLKSVQASQQQVAQAPEELGVAIYDALDEEETS